MIDPQDISLAMGAHRLWKQRLGKAIDSGISDVSPAQVERESNCDFGRWLGSISPADRDPVHFARVQELHAAFHKEAGHVLRLALSGQKAAAEQSMSPAGIYATISGALTSAMTDWKKAASD